MHAAARTELHRKNRNGQDDRADGGLVSRSDGTGQVPGPSTTTPATDHDTAACTAEQVRAALISALESTEFRSAPQLRSFLDFVVSAALEKKHDRIKGYTIAVEALGRPEDFNPVTDPIVRVEAARLRRRLAKYYSGSGACERVRIVIPKGSYAPEFELRPDAQPAGLTSSPVKDMASNPVSRESAAASGSSGHEATLEEPGRALSGNEGRGAEPAAMHSYKVVQPLSGHTSQPLFSKRISLAVAVAMALACFLAGLLAGSL